MVFRLLLSAIACCVVEKIREYYIYRELGIKERARPVFFVTDFPEDLGGRTGGISSSPAQISIGGPLRFIFRLKSMTLFNCRNSSIKPKGSVLSLFSQKKKKRKAEIKFVNFRNFESKQINEARGVSKCI